MALALFETPEQTLDRERRKFRTHVDTEVQRFTRGQEAIQARREQEARQAEQERQQKISFERRRFTELVTPTLDEYANDYNAEQDRRDGERSKFRELITPTLDQEQQRFTRAEEERAKFREAVGPSLETLRTPTATATPTPPDGRGGLLAFLRAGQATHPDEQEVQDEYSLMIRALQSGENIEEAARLAESHQAAHLNALRPEMRGTDRDPYSGWPGRNQAAADGFGLLLSRYGSTAATPTATATPTPPTPTPTPEPAPTPIAPPGYVAPVHGPGILGDIFREANQRLFEPTELIGGRAIQAVEPVVAAAAPGFAGPVGLAARGAQVAEAAGAPIPIPERFKLGTTVEQAGKIPGDIEAAANAAIGDEEDAEILRQRLTEIGLPERIVAGVILDPLNLIPGLGLTSELDTLRFLKGLGNIRRGAGLGDEAAESTVKVLRGAGEAAGDVTPGLAGLERDKLLRRLNQVLSEQAESSKEVIKARGAEFGGRAADYATIYKRELAAGRPPPEAHRIASRARAGGYEKLPGIPEGAFSEEDKLTMWNMVDENAALREGEAARSHDALTKLHTRQG
ncbi:hypothetical protein LCGC14_1975330, partial [marine sediment metagenome]